VKIDRYRPRGASESSRLYLLVAYGGALPEIARTDSVGYVTVGASDTRSLPEALCNEIERTIQADGYWMGDLPSS
jgi:hypothetical protein